MKIEELHFSVRTYNCLKRSRIDTVEHNQIGPEPEYGPCHRHIAGIIRQIEKL